MQNSLAKLEGVRQLLDPILGDGRNLARCPLGHADVDVVLRGGLTHGALHELFAGDTAASGFAACAAQRVSGARHMLWIVQDFSVLENGALAPTGFAELGIDASKLLLLQTANATDVLRAGVDALCCSGLGAVVMEIAGNPKVLDLAASRRLVLAAQRKNVTAFLLRQGAETEPSAAQTRWQIHSSRSAKTDDWGMPRFDAALIRNRQGETGHWVMEWSCEDGAFRKPDDETPHHGVMVRAPADRPAQAATRLAG